MKNQVAHQLASSVKICPFQGANNFTGGMAAFPSTFVTSLVGGFCFLSSKNSDQQHTHWILRLNMAPIDCCGTTIIMVVFTLISIHFWSQSIVLFGATVATVDGFSMCLPLANSGLSRLLVWNSVYGHPKHLEEKVGPLKTALYIGAPFDLGDFSLQSDSWKIWWPVGEQWRRLILLSNLWRWNLVLLQRVKTYLKASCWYPDAVGLQRSGIGQLVEIDV